MNVGPSQLYESDRLQGKKNALLVLIKFSKLYKHNPSTLKDRSFSPVFGAFEFVDAIPNCYISELDTVIPSYD